MHNITWIRENPQAFDAALARRGLPAQSTSLLALDEARRQSITRMQQMEEERNKFAKSIGQLKAQGKHDEAAEAMQRANTIKEQIAALKADTEGDDALHAALAVIPNLLAQDVPDGADENGNVEIRREGHVPAFTFAPKDHVALGEALGMMHFDAAAKMSGARFVVLSGPLARLERALAQFMLDLHTGEHGYVEHHVPYLVRDNALFGTGQLPKFAEDLFRTQGDHWLIPTSEVSLTNIVAEEILAEDSLPRRYTAHTPCFRSEAGSAGRDTRGMIRQHQFSKVELVSITTPDASQTEHQRMLGCAEEVLRRLGLPFRTMLLCGGDTGFSACKTYDLEVWLPSQHTYREISSCSNCGDFQARRMKARYKTAEGKNEFLHTLNGSGVAVGRALVAIMENYQDEDGSITVPEVLWPYMAGLKVIHAHG